MHLGTFELMDVENLPPLRWFAPLPHSLLL